VVRKNDFYLVGLVEEVDEASVLVRVDLVGGKDVAEVDVDHTHFELVLLLGDERVELGLEDECVAFGGCVHQGPSTFGFRLRVLDLHGHYVELVAVQHEVEQFTHRHQLEFHVAQTLQLLLRVQVVLLTRPLPFV